MKEWLNSEYPEAGWHAFGAIPPMPITEAIEIVGDYWHLGPMDYERPNDED